MSFVSYTLHFKLNFFYTFILKIDRLCYHVRREDEGRAVALEGAELLRVAQELAEVDVEEVPAVLHLKNKYNII